MAKAKIKPKTECLMAKPKPKELIDDPLHLIEVSRQVGAGVDLCVYSLSVMLSKLTDLKMNVQNKSNRGLLLADIKKSNELLVSHLAGIESWIETLEAEVEK